MFKSCTPFTDCMSEISNTQIENAKDLDIVMPMFNLIKYNHNYSKPYGTLWQYYRDEPYVNLADSESFRSKIKITESTPADGNTKDVAVITS